MKLIIILATFALVIFTVWSNLTCQNYMPIKDLPAKCFETINIKK